MRRLLLAAVAVCGLAACAGSPKETVAPAASSASSSGVWAYSFDAGPGIATAVMTGADNLPLVKLSCQSPNGNLVVTDWTFSRVRQGDTQATFAIGAQTKQVAARIAGDGAGRQALTMTLPSRDPMWNALAPAAAVKTTASGFTHNWAPESASRINDVLNSCRSLGS